MYELFVALKYLIPKKKALSTSVISLIAFVVISLVVWLTLVFLSVTAGLEKNWLHKLTSVNAPIRITPTDEYYKSFYYLADQLSANAYFETKTIGEKKISTTDVYSQDTDMEIPSYWKNPDLNKDGKIKDLVKLAYQDLNELKQDYPSLRFQDYEVSGAFMRLTLNRYLNNFSLKTSFLSQMTYILSLSELNPNLNDLIVKPNKDDLFHLLTKKDHNALKDRENSFVTNNKINNSVLENIHIKKIKLLNDKNVPYYLLPDNVAFNVQNISNENHTYLLLTNNKKSNTQIIKLGDQIKHLKNRKELNSFDAHKIFLQADQPITFDVVKSNDQNQTLAIKTIVQNKPLNGSVAFDQCHLIDIEARYYFEKEPNIAPLWVYFVKNKGWHLPKTNNSYGVLIPKSFQKNNVLIGDTGYFGYSSTTSSSSKEMRTPFYVAGFYDPGVFPLGNRFLIAPIDLIRIINSSSFVSTNEVSTNGIFVWNDSLKEAKKIKIKLQDKLKDNKIDQYWKVESYEDFEFSKDLFQQFQSDKLLFTLVAIIILMVACSNIISMLILLVNDKKKEIGILMALGATRKSIALIFGTCGFITGFLSSTTGVVLAIITLKYIDKIASLLSTIQGHQAFNVAFFGNSLPNSLSSEALLFILIATPIISLFAGLIPAYKASKLNPSQILRS
jgi:lipoprotein-releasing system permease protein